MSDFAERLRKLADAKNDQAAADESAVAFQDRVNKFIALHARAEYERLRGELEAKVLEVNPNLGDLPKYEFMQGNAMVQQGNCIASLYFDMPYTDLPSNQLLVGFGVHHMAMYFDEQDRPQPIRYKLHAAADDALTGIVWVGDLGEISTSRLVEFILENLTVYYLENRPK